MPVEKTNVFGCSTKWIEKSDNAKHAVEQWDKEPVAVAAIDVDAVKKLAANDSKSLVLVNVWATWCAVRGGAAGRAGDSSDVPSARAADSHHQR